MRHFCSTSAIARRLIALLTVMVLTVAVPATSVAAAWETVEAPAPDPTETETVDIDVFRGYIYLSANRQVTVKISSILGQVVNQATLKPGSYRIKLQSRGVYIVKVGSVTRRVNI